MDVRCLATHLFSQHPPWTVDYLASTDDAGYQYHRPTRTHPIPVDDVASVSTQQRTGSSTTF